MKKSMVWLAAPLFCLVFLVSGVQANVLNFTDYRIHNLDSESGRGMHRGIKNHRGRHKSKKKNRGKRICIVKLMGKTNHFGLDISQNPPEYIDYHATVPGVRVWISEYPFTRNLDIQTDETGWWTMYIIKYKDMDLEFSFIYEKEGWVTTKTNVITVTDEDNLDLAIQYIDPQYYYYVMKPAVEDMMKALGYPDFVFENALVVTVGKSWASMHDDRLPHGDPGAIAVLTPELQGGIGPIYFNEAVQPDPSYDATSVDGGVTWLNLPLDQTCEVTAEKPGVEYESVRFNLEESDVENGVELYISSTPDSVQGDNDSPPGEY
ncbi:hypothetical protein [Desulfospira joergensenii]|uniref:hypothetical protein n=1 Tax=Desulfospira joergensenii TaxID=53329 RepID=UPI0003B533A4|nr:hypothetical protein [Desulfospira joergensenii]